MKALHFRRRQILASVVGAGVLLAGCTDGGDPGSDDAGEDTDGEDNDIDPGLRLNGKVLNSSFPMELYDPESGERLNNVHWHNAKYSHWHFVPLEVPHTGIRSVEVVANDRELEKIPLGPDQTYQLSVYRTEKTPADLLEIDIDGSLVDFHGGSTGKGKVIFQLNKGDETVWISAPLLVEVA